MLRGEVAADLRDRRCDGWRLLPDYGGYCFADVPATAAGVLGVDLGPTLPGDVFDGVDTDVENVVVVLVDGLGFDCWRRDHADHALFDAVTREGVVTPLTSVFPSETSAAMVTVHTGLTPAEHGLLSWDVYLDDPGVVVEGVPFKQKGGSAGDAVDVLNPDGLFDGEPIYPALAEAGVEPHVVQPEGTLGTPFAAATLAGSERHGWADLDRMAATVRRVLESTSDSTYCYAYVPHVDAASHGHGTESAEYQDALAAISASVERELGERLDPDVADRTLLMVAADHGHVNTDPPTNVDLLAEYPFVTDALRRDGDGGRVPPVGNPRVTHLHVQPDRRDEVRRRLDAEMDALVLSGDDVLSEGLFGLEPGELAERRCGDVVLTHRDSTVWYDDSKSNLEKVGQNGGLTPAEMLVPFGAARLSALGG
jgi:hypothetical protein